MRVFLPLLIAVSLQAQESGLTDLILLTSQEEIRGRLVAVEESGVVRIEESGRERKVLLEDLHRVRFGGVVAGVPAFGNRLVLQRGISMAAKIDAIRDGKLAAESAYGRHEIPLAELKSVHLKDLDGTVPQLRDQPQDVVLSAAKLGKDELRAVPGPITEMDGERILVGDQKVARADARQLLFRATKPVVAATGWFLRVKAANGDRLVGAVRSITDREVSLFCPPIGGVTLSRSAVREIEMTPVARMTSGHFLICDQTGVREFDWDGREIWNYGRNTAYAWSARRLANGNILIANTNMGQVIEVRPKERMGGDVVWSMDGLNSPYDARKLDNGNVLIAEYYASRVFEVNPRDNSIAWEVKPFRNPITAERLPDGNTLICSSDSVVEVDAKGATVWKAKVPGLAPWRASRLENGNTLIVEQGKGQVIEIDRKSTVLWKREGLHRPYQAIRLDDGDTVILEQGRGQAVIYDPVGREVRAIEKLSYPINITTW